MPVSPGRAPRGAAFAPAVRGYPGGIADMAGEPDEDEPDLSLRGDELWEPGAEPGPGDAPLQAPAEAGAPAPGRPAPAAPVSVWQQSAAAWQETGIDWMRPAAAGRQPHAGPAAEEDPHTEPIPVLSADGSVRTADTAGRSPAEHPAAERPSPRTGADAGAPARRGRAGSGRYARTRRPRRGRRVTIAAVAALVLVAGALAAIGIERSGGGPAEAGFRLLTPYPAAAPADAELAGRAAGVTPLQASLTGIASAGKTVVAIGAEPSQPAPVALILYSADGGRTWARATLAGPAAAAAPAATGPGPGLAPGPGAAGGPGAVPVAGTVPVLIARGGGTWLALGQRVAWTSPDGRTWRQAPPPPTATGDTVLGLAGTGSGFVAVGEHTGTGAGPVVWTAPAGRGWQRWTGTAHGLSARGGHVTGLRWAAAAGGVVVAGGPVTGAAGQGGRPAAGLWRSTDGGRTWAPVRLPAGHGATAALAGLASDGSAFVAVRTGHAGGHQDAVTYLSAQGSTWRYAGKLTPVRQASLQVTGVSGGGHGFVVAGAVRDSEVAFFSAHGLGWQQTASPGSGVMAGLTAGPGGALLVAGNTRPGTGVGIRPHLLLSGPAGRGRVGQAVLAAAATPDVTVNGLAAYGRALVAAGASGGSPALWLATAGHWAPAGVLLPAAWRSGALVSVVHGGGGWLAIGHAAAPGLAGSGPPPAQPVVLTSAAGASWTPVSATSPLAAPGASLTQAAAGRAGYVVVGSAPPGGTAPGAAVPVAWYSKDLGTWSRARLPVPGGAAPGGGAAARQVLAVTAAAPGFVAVGSAGRGPAAWTSPTGSGWRFTAVPRPAGAVSAVLAQVSAAGGRVVAAGYEWRAGQAPVPFTAASADGGRTWRDSVLPALPAPALVTALTAAGHGFVAVGRRGAVAAGHTGLPGRPAMLAWWSSDGLTWHGGVPAGGGRGGPFVTQINAVTAGNGTLTGAGFAASTAAEHPVLWHARYR